MIEGIAWAAGALGGMVALLYLLPIIERHILREELNPDDYV